MLTGMFIPVQIMPPALQIFGLILLPQTRGMDLLRHYAMGTRTILGVEQEWLVLGARFAVFGLLAWYSVARLERSAREEGLHYV